jgi:two-component system, chemotaxis family, chemotaxis protein CheY
VTATQLASAEGAETGVAQRKCVLVVEDDAMIRSALAGALSDEGYQVLTATNGLEGLEEVRRGAPDAVLLDLMMPVLDGWGFLAQCRHEQLCADTPVLVMSAYLRLPEIAGELKVRGCIAKPFDLDVLLGAVERLVRLPRSATPSHVAA